MRIWRFEIYYRPYNDHHLDLQILLAGHWRGKISLIQAIKRHRALVQTDLKTSKEYCEQLFDKHYGKDWRTT